jgi:hypothetical protein
MTARIHYACDGTWFDYDEGCYEQVPACGNDFHGRKKLTDDPDAVTCPTCRELCGISNVVPILDLETRHLGDNRYGVAA